MENIKNLKTSSVNIVLALTFCLIFCFGLSLVYGIIIAVSPLVYINFFITVAFGLGLGYAVKIFSKLFKIVSSSIRVKIAILVGVFGIYFSWVSYILYHISLDPYSGTYFSNSYLFFNPVSVAQIMADIAQQGLWAFFGIVFTGFPLVLIWLIEAGIIFIIPFLMVKKHVISPFSSTHNKWYIKYVLSKDFESLFSESIIIENLSVGVISYIDSLKTGRATNYSRISIFFLEEEIKQYLWIENVRKVEQGKKQEVTEIVTNYIINREEAKELIKKYYAKKEFFLDY